MNDPKEVVGHLTFDAGRGEDGLPRFRHEPLTREVADAIIAEADAAKARRAAAMPTEREATHVLHNAWLRLKELGWHEAQYAPKDPSKPLELIEVGSTGIHRGYRDDVSFWIIDDDSWPSRPVLYRGERTMRSGQRPKE